MFQSQDGESPQVRRSFRSLVGSMIFALDELQLDPSKPKKEGWSQRREFDGRGIASFVRC